ncbi:MAG: BsuBI/PstI family type II restriction endonuclease [Rivularia sp. (in: cyanobacteria)]
MKHFLELKKLTEECEADIIFVTAFLNRKTFRQFAPDIAWETFILDCRSTRAYNSF